MSLRSSARLRPSPALAVSIVALVVATGGTSYAAAKIGSAGIANNSIRGVDIRNGTIGSIDVADGHLAARDVQNGTLTGADVKDGSLTASDLAEGVAPAPARWLLVDATGTIEAQSGGFTVASAYDVLGAPPGAVGNVYINANEDLSDNGIVATIALQNQVDQNTDGITNGRSLNPDANPEFSGEITATKCAIAGVVACAPTGTNDNNHLVVSPRNSDGQVTRSTDRKRFYVIITGDSSDYVAPDGS